MWRLGPWEEAAFIAVTIGMVMVAIAVAEALTAADVAC
jgi:hypothetical protein